ncbi:MAG: hypothetical protein IKD86_03995, partial [Firmicutes bacterium]|nr:hypothetical protein [Bacillota bacterium]
NRKSEDVVAIQILPDEEAFMEERGSVPDSAEMETIMNDLVREVNGQLTVNQMIRKVIVRDKDFIRTTTLKIKRQENID